MLASVRGPGKRSAFLLAGLLTFLSAAGSARAAGVEEARLRAAAVAGDWQQVQAMGRGVLPALARLYEASSEKERATIAYVFYQLGWKSPEAKRALMADVHTPDQALQILTHQTKDFQPGADAETRARAVAAWKRWLAEYRANL